MSILTFHRVLIGTAIAFALFFGAWLVGRYLAGGGALSLVGAALSGATAAGLGWYLLHLRRFLGLEGDR